MAKTQEMKTKIVNEVVDKILEYQTRNVTFLNDYNEWSDIFTIKRPGKKSNTFSNPRLSEMFRAANTLATMEYRMMTNQDPFFEFMPVDIIGVVNPESPYKATELIRTQLEKSKFKANLFKSLLMKNVFGTVIVEEPVDTVRISHLGRKLFLTKFVPRSLLQIFFDRSAVDISEGSYLAVSDIVNTYWLEAQRQNEDIVSGWANDELNSAISKNAEKVEIDEYIQARLTAAGYDRNKFPENTREFITYYGKLDILNDGVEYIVGIVNRKYLVKFASNPIQTGRRPFRIAHFLNWELEPLGYGLGKLFTSLHKSMDNNRQRMQDVMAFTSYNPMLRNRYAGISDKDMVIKPWQIIDADDVNNALKPMEFNATSVPHAITLEKLMQEEFRAASGATNTLQAIITEATASEVSLAQNEAVRNISVKAELAAESLLREHIENMHFNNMLFIKDKVTLSSDGSPLEIYPNDLLIDIDVKLKIVTDKDFKPERLKKLLEYYTIVTSIRNVNPDMMGIDTKPLVAEINKALDVSGKVLVGLTPERIQEVAIATQLMNKFREAASPGMMAQMERGENLPEQREGEAVVRTPIGETLASPPATGA